MTKTSITNKRQDPLYKWLRDNSELNGGDMQWNFEKFLIDKNGHVLGHWWATDEPDVIRKDIEALVN